MLIFSVILQITFKVVRTKQFLSHNVNTEFNVLKKMDSVMDSYLLVCSYYQIFVIL